jgi:hypothetical protein
VLLVHLKNGKNGIIISFSLFALEISSYFQCWKNKHGKTGNMEMIDFVEY